MSAIGASENRTHSLSLSDHAEQIAFVVKVHDDKHQVAFLHDLVQGDYARMSAGELVQSNLAALEMPLSCVQPGAEEHLDGEVDGRGRVQVYGEVDDTVSADAEDRDELEAAIVDGLADEIDTRGGKSHLGHVEVGAQACNPKVVERGGSVRQ